MSGFSGDVFTGRAHEDGGTREPGIYIPLRHVLRRDDLLTDWWEDAHGRKWSEVSIDIAVAPKVGDGPELVPKTFRSQWVLYHGRNADNCDDKQFNGKGTELVAYYIALKLETATDVRNHQNNVLDWTNFQTNGYIPVCLNQQDARRALNIHCQRNVVKMKEYKITIQKGSNLYYRRDRSDRWKSKLFFPIPLGADAHNSAHLYKRYDVLKKNSRWPKWYDWNADFSKIDVNTMT